MRLCRKSSRRYCSRAWVTLRGAPGIGKSSLAVAAAHYLHQRRKFPDGVFFLQLRNLVSTEQNVQAYMARVLGIQVEDDLQLFVVLKSSPLPVCAGQRPKTL